MKRFLDDNRGEPGKSADLFEEEKDIPEWATVNTRGIQIERLRRFGDVYLGLALWKRLKLDDIFEKLQKQGREDRSSVRLRIVAKPDEHVRVLLQRLEIKIPNRLKLFLQM